VTTANGSTVYIPNSIGWRSIEWKQRRTAVTGALQWAPNDDWSFALQGLYTKADPKDIEHALGDTEGGYNPNQAGNVYGDDGVIQSGIISPFKPTADTRYTESHKKTSDWSLNGKWLVNDSWNVSGDVQYVKSHADVTSMTAFTQLGGAPFGSLNFDLRGDTPTLTLNQPAQADQAAYWWAAAMDHIEDNDAHSWAERLDADHKFEENDWLDSFRVGVRATDRNAITRQTGYNWSLLSQQFWGPAESPPAYINSYAPHAAELFTYDNFFRGNVKLPGVAWFPTAGVVGNGTQYAYEALKGTQLAGWGWTPLSTDYALAKPGADNPNGGVNNQNEKTQAAYAMLRFAHDSSPLGPWDGNVGVRVVKTNVDATGLLVIAPLENVLPLDTCIAQNGQAACAALASATAFSAGGNVPGFTQENDYTDVLPTLNVRFKLTEDLQLRFALGKAIVRPTFSQMMPYTTLSYKFESDGFTPDDVTPITGSGGNPKLKPTRAKQFDTSVEWYFAPTGSLTLAGFYKDVRDYIFLGQSEETYTSNGQEATFLVTRNMNGDKGKIKGFELAYAQFYDQLPGIFSGFGLQANFTLVDSSGGRNTAINILEPAQVNGAADQTLPLEGLSKTSYNLTGLYEKHNYSARLAYNWRERYLLTTSAANIQRPVWMEDYGQLDASLFYSVNPKLKFGVEGTNLLNTRTFLDVGGASLAPRYSWTDTDRRIAVAMRMQF
jgi:TonB-dependent receptor